MDVLSKNKQLATQVVMTSQLPGPAYRSINIPSWEINIRDTISPSPAQTSLSILSASIQCLAITALYNPTIHQSELEIVKKSDISICFLIPWQARLWCRGGPDYDICLGLVSPAGESWCIYHLESDLITR